MSSGPSPGTRRQDLPVLAPTRTRKAPESPGWLVARWSVLMAGLLLLAGLALRPAAALPVFWRLAVPLLPALFLVHPALWRNVCPLATVGMGPRETARGRGTRRAWSRRAGSVGALLLFVVVPARHLVFDHDGPALAALLLGLGAAAWIAGRLLPRKAGFCNAFCPLLPVERLYGQAPVLDVSNPRCADCSACAPVGCLDLSPEKTVAQMIGPARRGPRWTFTAYGAFAAAFPGFVVGFFTATPDATPGAVYLWVWTGAAVSWGLVTALVKLTGWRASRLTPVLGGVAAGAFYAFTVPSSVEALHLPAGAAAPLVGTTLVLVGAWSVRALLLRRRV